MPRVAGFSTPKYRLHRPSGQAVVTIGGKDHYLGPHRTKASLAEYDRLIGEWLAAGRTLPQSSDSCGLTIAELCIAYKRFAEAYYRKDGVVTGAMDGIKVALRTLRQCYGHTQASDFGPLALAALCKRFVDDGACRRYANDHLGRIRRVFRWAATQELLPISIYQALAAVPGLRRGRTDAGGNTSAATTSSREPRLPTPAQLAGGEIVFVAAFAVAPK